MEKGVDSLTLKVIGKDDNSISADSFLTVIRETIAILRDLDGDNALKWSVTGASMQSPFSITFTAEQVGEKPLPPMRVSRQYSGLFDRMDKGDLSETISAKAALRAGRLVNTLNNGVQRIEMTPLDEKPVVPTQRVQATASELSSARRNEYWEYTTLEGDLRTVSVSGGSKFFIFDRLTEQPTLCVIQHDKIEAAKELLEHRVWVRGRSKWRNGRTIRVDVEEFGGMPNRGDLPQFADIVGIDIGSEDSVAFVRRQRDAI